MASPAVSPSGSPERPTKHPANGDDDDEGPSATQKLAEKGRTRWALGLDGSKLSWKAFELVTGLMARRQVVSQDELTVLHVAAPAERRAQLPASLRPEKLRADVEVRNVRLSLPIRFEQHEAPAESSVSQVVW